VLLTNGSAPTGRTASVTRLGRLALLTAVLFAALVLLHRTAQSAVARAVLLAPNAARGDEPLAALAMPQTLADRGAFVLRTRVGPPDAELVSWVAPALSHAVEGTVVLLHGVRMDKRSLVPMGVALVDAGYRVVMVDLRGHGESSGRYLTYGAVETRDVTTVLDSLSERVPLRSVGAYGFSYGGAVVLELGARDPRVQAVVAVSAFSSLREVVGDYERKYLPGPLKLIPDAWFQEAVDEAGAVGGFDPDAQSPLAAVEHSSERILLIHGALDTQVPPRHSRELAAAAGARTRLVTLPAGTHDSMPADASGAVRHETIDWFRHWLMPPQREELPKAPPRASRTSRPSPGSCLRDPR
jgi:pimeloyl-ACP methyl ester carboxylesterase